MNNPVQKQLPIEVGGVQLQMGTVMDIYPTLVSLSGAKNPQGHIVDGVDLRDQLEGKRNNSRPETVLMHFPHEHRGSYFTTYIEGDWKLIYYYNPENPSEPRYRLYNLKKDPGESLDVSGRNPKLLVKMIKAMTAQLDAEGALYPEDAKGNVLRPFLPDFF